MLKYSHASVLATAAFAFLGIASMPARADETASIENVLVCDTPEEVEAIVNADEKDVWAKLSKVNAQFGKDACVAVTAMFYRGDVAKSILAHEGVVRIIKVTMIRVRQNEEWKQLATPMEQYAGVLENATSI